MARHRAGGIRGAEAHPVDYREHGGADDLRAARRAGDEAQLAIAQHNRGHHGTERTLARRDGVAFALHQPEHIRLAGLRGEIVHLVVEQKSARRGDAGAVAVVDGVSVGDGVAVGVHHAEVGGVAFALRFPQMKALRLARASTALVCRRRLLKILLPSKGMGSPAPIV